MRVASKKAKMLTLKMENLVDDARMIVQVIHLKMLKRTKGRLERAEKEALAE